MGLSPTGLSSTVPVTAAIVKLNEGLRVTDQRKDVGDQPVEMVTRKMRNDGDERGVIVYGYKFRPKILYPNMDSSCFSICLAIRVTFSPALVTLHKLSLLCPVVPT